MRQGRLSHRARRRTRWTSFSEHSTSSSFKKIIVMRSIKSNWTGGLKDQSHPKTAQRRSAFAPMTGHLGAGTATAWYLGRMLHLSGWSRFLMLDWHPLLCGLRGAFCNPKN